MINSRFFNRTSLCLLPGTFVPCVQNPKNNTAGIKPVVLSALLLIFRECLENKRQVLTGKLHPQVCQVVVLCFYISILKVKINPVMTAQL